MWLIFLLVILLLLYRYRPSFGISREEKIFIKNSSKHACKCYMENLTEGEQRVATLLARELNFKDYFLFNNLTVYSKYKISSQIDHLIVSRFGIFVIENKDYSGWIYGDRYQAVWTKTYKTGDKFKFQNPMQQNYGHIMALRNVIPLSGNVFKNLTVFSGNAEIRTAPIEGVLYLNDLLDYIKKYTEEIISEADMQMVIGRLSYACQTIDVTAKEHVDNVNRYKPSTLIPNINHV